MKSAGIPVFLALTALMALGCSEEERTAGPVWQDFCTGMEGGHAYVDLGLTVKWASCNVGADRCYQQGDYFAWGETQPYYASGQPGSANLKWKQGRKDGYYWSSFRFCTFDSEHFTAWLTKYNADSQNGIVDSLDVLDRTDDAARAAWGGAWRMPSAAQAAELLDSCDWIWTDAGNLEFKGVAGWKVSGASGEYKSNWIFLPVTGCYDGNEVKRAAQGEYWLNSVVTSSPMYAHNALISKDSKREAADNRYGGRAIRAVHDRN